MTLCKLLALWVGLSVVAAVLWSLGMRRLNPPTALHRNTKHSDGETQ